MRRSIVLAIGLAAVLRLAHLSAVAASTLPAWQDVELASDYAATWQWAQQILSGNLLGIPTFHPRTPWMAALGTPADWARWWGGEATFQQAPLYPYLVALIVGPPAHGPLRLLFLQALLSVLVVPCVASLATRWSGGDLEAGTIAAFLWAAAQPVVALDAFMVRDSLGLCLTVLALWAAERALEDGRLRSAALAGGVLALAALDRENLLPLAVLVPALLAWRSTGGRRARLMRAAACAGATLVMLSPLVVRNAIAGAPPLALSNRAPEAVIEGLSFEPDGDPIGFQLPRRMGELLERAHGSGARAVAVCLAQAPGPGTVARWMARKLWGQLSPYEPADNVDLNYLTWISPLLKLLVPTAVLIWLGLLGFALKARAWRTTPLAVLAPLLLAAPLALTSVLWRIRAGLLPVAIPLAAIGLAWLVGALRGSSATRRRGAIAGGLLVAGLLAAYLLPPRPLFRLRTVEVLSSAQIHLREGAPDAALAELDAWLARARDDRLPPARIAQVEAVRARIAGGDTPSR